MLSRRLKVVLSAQRFEETGIGAKVRN